jgi:hypothetical protein
MRLLRPTLRELYRVYTEEEFFELGALHSDCARARQGQRRNVAVASPPRRATLVVLLAGVVGAVAALSITAGLGHRRSVRRSAWTAEPLRRSLAAPVQQRGGGPGSGNRRRAARRHRGGRPARADAAIGSGRRSEPAPQRRHIALATASGARAPMARQRELLPAASPAARSIPRRFAAVAAARHRRADFTFEQR